MLQGFSIRTHLSHDCPNKQFAFDGFQAQQTLDAKSQLACGIVMSRKMDRLWYQVTNKSLVNRFRWTEFLDILSQFKPEFGNAEEIRHLFQSVGVDTRQGDVYELYLTADNLVNNYCVQVSMDGNADFFVKLKAYTKESTSKSHWWEGL